MGVSQTSGLSQTSGHRNPQTVEVAGSNPAPPMRGSQTSTLQTRSQKKRGKRGSEKSPCGARRRSPDYVREKPGTGDSHQFASGNCRMSRGRRRAHQATHHAWSATGCARLPRRHSQKSVVAIRSKWTAARRRPPPRRRKPRWPASNPIEFRVCRRDQRSRDSERAAYLQKRDSRCRIPLKPAP
jgi:hypothetical protein